MEPKLPPGPSWPTTVQTLAWWTRPLPFFERCRARYGTRFTTHLVATPPFVHLSDPDDIREVFTAAPEDLHPGEGARILEPVVGPHSVILLDEDAHLEQRRLLLPAFHGERMRRLTGLVDEAAEREVARWPADTPFALHPSLQRLTLEIILRAVFGLEEGARLDRLRTVLTDVLTLASGPLGMIPALQRDLGARSPGARYARVKAEADALILELVDERRATGLEEGDDVLAMLLAARHHDDGTPMSRDELRDELVTALVAGHETTASQLAWTFVRLAREPGVLRELVRELDAGESDEYLDAVMNESLRDRPVLPNAEPRLTKRPYTVGGWTYPEGVVLAANAYLVHHDPGIYPDPHAFRPERFLGVSPGTYTFLPWGGGRRRCLGASFAQLEIRAVLRAALTRWELDPVDGAAERVRRRSITISPHRGARVVLRRRTRREATAPARDDERSVAGADGPVGEGRRSPSTA